MVLFQTEGIVLKSTLFRDNDRILTVFTTEFGLIKIFSRVWRGSPLEIAIANPFVHAEFVLNQGKNDFFYLKESFIINQHLNLRSHEKMLSNASQFIQAILLSQWLHKPAQDLFRLLSLFLESLPKTSFPETFLAAFYLKLLKHEGVLETKALCCTCQIPLEVYYRSHGEVFCSTHQPPHSEIFSHEEEEWLVALSNSRNFTAFSFEISESFLKKIHTIFSQVFERA